VAALRINWRELSVRLSAEFAIVVLGVTVALWADSWVADRADREEEIKRLLALQENIAETITDIVEERENISGATDALHSLLSFQNIPTEQRIETLGYGLLYGPVFTPELNVYDDLKNSGELALLTNADLRSSLAKMETRLGILQLAMSDLSDVQHLEIDSFVVNETELRFFYGAHLGVEQKTVETESDIGFMSDIRFQNRVLLKLDLIAELETRLADAESALEEVHRTIMEQLALHQL
jgi:hypothetical protein